MLSCRTLIGFGTELCVIALRGGGRFVCVAFGSFSNFSQFLSFLRLCCKIFRTLSISASYFPRGAASADFCSSYLILLNEREKYISPKVRSFHFFESSKRSRRERTTENFVEFYEIPLVISWKFSMRIGDIIKKFLDETLFENFEYPWLQDSCKQIFRQQVLNLSREIQRSSAPFQIFFKPFFKLKTLGGFTWRQTSPCSLSDGHPPRTAVSRASWRQPEAPRTCISSLPRGATSPGLQTSSRRPAGSPCGTRQFSPETFCPQFPFPARKNPLSPSSTTEACRTNRDGQASRARTRGGDEKVSRGELARNGRSIELASKVPSSFDLLKKWPTEFHGREITRAVMYVFLAPQFN